ncbi:hypothetical protein N866_00135 [Actinotalea ferrariae CF5-4]|uniref:ATPase n=1 Tax=Actinotalea ferrariae CF5-4 TaxID=948458 RepID=A0A021VVS9_9CELL|nr:ATP-binding protein [Actinotalea ferrariae]EYR65228.1 hypothetical protein N866_00135 [Actinotalea ferrariae CF5-4]
MTLEPEAADSTIDLTPSPRILEMIAEVDLDIYQCLAELIDNSFDELQRAREEDPSQEYRVDVSIPTQASASRASEIIMSDTGRGMSQDQMRTALRAGSSGNSMFGSLGLFGMGFNVATARLGQITEVRTGRAGDDTWSIATIDLAAMQRQDTFTVPLHHEPKDRSEHGTVITVSTLKPDIVAKLQRPSEVTKTKRMLGRIYSFILRDPKRHTFSGSEIAGGLGLPLYLNGNPVKPVLPCIWDPERTVTYRGQDVTAVQVIDVPLTDAYACMTCGHWHANPRDECVLCGSTQVVQRERQIKGWLGIQRYNHNSDFGISFLRHGRAITYQDKDLFQWLDEDTPTAEYPVEIGGGRIVGEIHLDHAPVNFRKTDFAKDQVAWTVMRDRVRGEGPLRPQKAQELGMPANESPLARLFNAFRRNDPGLKNLVPGNGKAALHELARKWAEEFRKEVPGYETDQKWYDAAKQHDDIVNGVHDPAAEGEAESDWLAEEGLEHLDTDHDTSRDDAPDGEGPDESRPPSPPETVEERFARYLASARPLSDLEGKVRVGPQNLTLRAYVTSGVSFSPDDGGSEHFVLRAPSGETQLYVAEESPLVSEFGWDPADAAVVYAVPYLMRLYDLGGTQEEVLHDVIGQFPDRRIDPATIRDRGTTLLGDIREGVLDVVRSEPPAFWSSLRPESRTAAEDNARAARPDLNWEEAISDGSFAAYLTASGVEDVLRAKPEALLDGKVFTSTYATWSDQKDAQVDRLAGLLQDLRRVTASGATHDAREIARFSLSLDLLRRELVQ